VPDVPVSSRGGGPGARVPFVHEEECVGCNLCQLVCPVPGCITMKEVPTGQGRETWNDRVEKGTNVVPGGLEATQRAKAG
jgi:dihydropyrimidine dehydrogenase (NAD+) subunit PreA